MTARDINQSDFRTACSKFPTGVTVVTTAGADGTPYGVTVSSFTSVSLDPPLVLACIHCRSQITSHLEVGSGIGVNVLGEQQQQISIHFSKNWTERFAEVSWYPGYTGVPLLFDVSAMFECSVVEKVLAGDHTIVIARVLYARSGHVSPLAYCDRLYGKIALGTGS